MAQPGDIRWNDQAEQFEILVERFSFLPDEWRPLQEERPDLFSQLAAVVKSGLFDAVDNDSESGVVHFRKAQTDEWMDTNEAITAWTNLKKYGERPVNWPDYEEWPPTRLQTSAEAKEAGNVDEAGKPIPTRIVNTKAVTSARAAETKYRTDQEKSARDYQAQQANIATDNKRAQEALDLQKEEFAYRQQQDALQPKRPSSLVGLMAEALDSGNTERARGLWEFENQITPLQYLQLTMEYADNPEALKVLFDFVQARRPGIIGGQGQGPVSGQPSQVTPPTTAELQAQQATRDALFKAQQSGIYQSQPAPDLGEGMFRSSAGTPWEVGSALGKAQQQAQGGPSGPFRGPSNFPYDAVPQGDTGPFRGPSNFPGGEVDLPGDPSRQGPVARDATFNEFMLTGPDLRETPEERAARAAGPVKPSAPAPQQIALGEDPNFANRQIFRLEDELAQQPTSVNQTEAMKLLNYSPGMTVRGPIAYTSSGHPYELQPGESIFSGGRTISHPDPAPVAPTPTTTPSPFNPIDLEGYLKAAQTLSASKKPKQRSPFGAPRLVRQR